MWSGGIPGGQDCQVSQCYGGLLRLCAGDSSIAAAVHPPVSHVQVCIKVVILQNNINIAYILELSTKEQSLYNGIKISGIHLVYFVALLSNQFCFSWRLGSNSWLMPLLWKLLELLLMEIHFIIFLNALLNNYHSEYICLSYTYVWLVKISYFEVLLDYYKSFTVLQKNYIFTKQNKSILKGMLKDRKRFLE